MIAVIYSIVIWIIVPVVILAVLTLAIRITQSASDIDLKVSARAGFWAGLLLFVVYIVSQLATLQNTDFTLQYFNYQPQFNLFVTIAGVVAGFAVLSGIKFLIPTRLVGLVTLFLTWGSTSALFSYIFIETTRDLVMCFALGFIVGVLIYIMVFPAPFQEIWS